MPFPITLISLFTKGDEANSSAGSRMCDLAPLLPKKLLITPSGSRYRRDVFLIKAEHRLQFHFLFYSFEFHITSSLLRCVV